MIENFELSIMTGTRAMSGSAAIRFRNSDHRPFGIDQAFVHVDVDDLGAIGDLITRDVEGGGIVAVRDQLAEVAPSQ